MAFYDIDESTKANLRAYLPEVMKHYKNVPIKGHDQKYMVCCPFHADRNPSCEIDPIKGVYHCFGCGASGDVFTLVAGEEGLDLTRGQDFQTAAKIIADIGGIDLKLKDGPGFPGIKVPEDDAPNGADPDPAWDYVPPKDVEWFQGNANQSNLYKYLCSLYSTDEVNKVFARYQVGGVTRKEKSWSIFPLVNASGHCVDAHMMPYHADGHRYNEHKWRLKELNGTVHRAPWPLFGEHLLATDPTAPVGLVESEKTALLATMVAPDFIWLATSGKSNLNAERCSAIRDRECYIFPDVDGLETWRAQGTAMAAKGFNLYWAGDYITRHATGDHDDLADIIARCRDHTQGTSNKE